MVFSDRTYSVLLLSASEVFNRAVLPLLPSSRFYPVTLVTDLRAAKDCAPCDLVIVNAPLRAETAFRTVPGSRRLRTARSFFLSPGTNWNMPRTGCCRTVS